MLCDIKEKGIDEIAVKWKRLMCHVSQYNNENGRKTKMKLEFKKNNSNELN